MRVDVPGFETIAANVQSVGVGGSETTTDMGPGYAMTKFCNGGSNSDCVGANVEQQPCEVFPPRLKIGSK